MVTSVYCIATKGNACWLFWQNQNGKGIYNICPFIDGPEGPNPS